MMVIVRVTIRVTFEPMRDVNQFASPDPIIICVTCIYIWSSLNFHKFVITLTYCEQTTIKQQKQIEFSDGLIIYVSIKLIAITYRMD